MSAPAPVPLKLVLLVGSTRAGRFGPTVARWFAEQTARHGDFELDLLDLAELDLPAGLPAHDAAPDPRTTALAARLAAADAFVVVTPEYNHSYPAPLKDTIDRFRTEWHAKPVAFVSYGGASGGLRAVEHLRLVFGELHAAAIRNVVSFHNVWECFTGDGHPTDPAGHEAAAKNLLDQLLWWARALREARISRPYAA
jgi:NAD(P)H-dependent FMN reductase